LVVLDHELGSELVIDLSGSFESRKRLPVLRERKGLEAIGLRVDWPILKGRTKKERPYLVKSGL
jgi:hypothetical protein